MIFVTYQIIPPQPQSLCSISVKYHPGQTSVSSTEQNNMNMEINIVNEHEYGH